MVTKSAGDEAKRALIWALLLVLPLGLCVLRLAPPRPEPAEALASGDEPRPTGMAQAVFWLLALAVAAGVAGRFRRAGYFGLWLGAGSSGPCSGCFPPSCSPARPIYSRYPPGPPGSPACSCREAPGRGPWRRSCRPSSPPSSGSRF